MLASEKDVILNDKKAEELIGQDLGNGIESFQDSLNLDSLNLGKIMYLPKDPKYWPSKENIEKRYAIENSRSRSQA